MRFEITLEVDVELTEPLTVQELARLENVFGAGMVAALQDPDEPVTPTQTRAVIWTKLQTQFPNIAIDQFDSIADMDEVSVG